MIGRLNPANIDLEKLGRILAQYGGRFARCDPAVAFSRARQARLLPQLGAALLLLEQCAAAAHRFGGAAVDPARMPRFDLPEDLQRAAQGYDLSAEPDRPGALVQFARALGLVAAQGSVE